MKKCLIYSSMMVVLMLSACAGPSSPTTSSSPASSSSEPQKEEIKLVNASSKLIGTPKANPEAPTQTLPEFEENLLISNLPTYHRKGKGDVPYINIAEYATAADISISYLLKAGLTNEVKDDGFHLYAPGKKGELIFNAENDTIKVKNSGEFVQDVFIDNNGLTGDYISYRGNSVKASEKTKAYKNDGTAIPEYDTYSVGNYGYDIYKEGDKYYAPLSAITKLMYRDASIDVAYNGKDFYINAAINGYFTASRIFSSKGWWRGYGAVWQPVEKGQGEAYRFACSFERPKESGEGTETCTKFLILNDNELKNGKIIACRGDTYDPSKEIPTEESGYTYIWKKEDNLLRIRFFENGAATGDYWVNLDETYFLKNTISDELSEYNYNTLRFIFDNFYGLKYIKDYADAEAYFTTLGVKDDLKSKDVNKYNDALAKLICSTDDGHSQLTGLTTLTSLDNFLDLPNLNKKYGGQRVKTLTDKFNTYKKARVDKMHETDPSAPDDPNFYQGIKLSSDKNTVVFTFDAFQHNDPAIKNMKELFPDGVGADDWTFEDYNRNLVRARFINSTPEGMSAAFATLDKMNTDHATKNVVFNLTLNGGGQISTLAYLAAFFSKDPTYVLTDPRTNTTYEYHYQVDLNGDGVYGGEGDTYQGKYNFYFLTSGFSFSCGNCLPGIGKDNGVKIIGEKSGGGTSPVGFYFDGLGSSIDLSNYRLMSYKGSDGKYVHNDAGIPLDYEFALNNGNWYDADAINTFIKSLG